MYPSLTIIRTTCIWEVEFLKASFQTHCSFLFTLTFFYKSSSLFKFNLLADDSTLSVRYRDVPVKVLSDNINRELIPINLWLLLNEIKAKVTKRKFTIFSYSCSYSSVRSRKYVFFWPKKISVSSIFEPQIDAVLNKMSKSVGVVYRLNQHLPSNLSILF